GLEHRVARPGDPAPFEPVVVVHAHAGEHRDLFTAQPRHAAGAAVRRQTGLVRGEPCAARGEELTDIALGIHAWRLAPAGGTSQVLAVPGTAGGPAPAAARFIRTGRARLPRHGRRRRSRRRRRRWTDPAATAARCR